MFHPPTDQIDFNPPNRPPRPSNENKGANMAEPSERDIATAVEITGCDRYTAVRHLKAKDNNLEAALNSLIEGEDISAAEQHQQQRSQYNSSGWDEGAFTGDRDSNNPYNSHHEQGNQNLHPLGAPSTAPTRGPSPAPSLNNSNQNQNPNPNPNTMNPNNKADEDSQLEAALAASRQDAGMSYETSPPQQQETGTINSAGQSQQFGPANRSNYDASQWAMVTTAPTAREVESEEIIPDSEAEQRRCGVGEPRLLKHSAKGGYLGSLVTVLHAVPAAALVGRDRVVEGYGSEGEWWRGSVIRGPRIVDVGGGGGVGVGDEAEEGGEGFLEECQRLMAFLDESQRSYGSAEALAQMGGLKSVDGKGRVERFVKTWGELAGTIGGASEEQAGMFETIVGTNAQEGLATDGRMQMVEMAVRKAEGEQKPQLQELLDDLLWDTDPASESLADNWIEKPADVLVMRVYQQDASVGEVGLEVPAAFHVDKYLKENVDATRAVRREMMKGRQRVAKITSIEDRLRNHQHPTKSAKIDALAMLQRTQKHFSGANNLPLDEGTTNAANGPGTPTSMEDRPSHYSDTAARLQNVIDSVNSKLTVLASEKAKTLAAIASVSKDPLPDLPQNHRYTLRGVATKPNITYLLYPKPTTDSPTSYSPGGTPLTGATDANAMDTSTDTQPLIQTEPDEDTAPEGYEWWRLAYEVLPSGSPRVTKTRTADYDVLRAVELEHHEALLIYASDAACESDSETTELPRPLQIFVDKDNAAFEAEVNLAALAAKDWGPATFADMNEENNDARMGRERRFSNNSTTVQGGDSPPSYDEVGFESGAGFGLPPAGTRAGDGNGNGNGNRREGREGRGSTPVHEIRLDDEMGEEGAEMVERAHEPLMGGIRTGEFEEEKKDRNGWEENRSW